MIKPQLQAWIEQNVPKIPIARPFFCRFCLWRAYLCINTHETLSKCIYTCDQQLILVPFHDETTITGVDWAKCTKNSHRKAIFLSFLPLEGLFMHQYSRNVVKMYIYLWSTTHISTLSWWNHNCRRGLSKMYQNFPSRGHFYVVFASGELIYASILMKRCQNVDKLVINNSY